MKKGLWQDHHTQWGRWVLSPFSLVNKKRKKKKEEKVKKSRALGEKGNLKFITGDTKKIWYLPNLRDKLRQTRVGPLVRFRLELMSSTASQFSCMRVLSNSRSTVLKQCMLSPCGGIWDRSDKDNSVSITKIELSNQSNSRLLVIVYIGKKNITLHPIFLTNLPTLCSNIVEHPTEEI